MTNKILVFGATGQQGGSVAAALLAAGWEVRALVRDPESANSLSLRRSGAELLRGDFADSASIRAAMGGVHGVFSVQPSSPQFAQYGLSDEDEVRIGVTIADIAEERGISHFVYSSGGGAGDTPSGMGHFDSKPKIEAHLRTLRMNVIIVRPASFMEMLMMPGFGLDQGRFNFLPQPDQQFQVIAVEDIGRIVRAVFSDRARSSGTTSDIASDTVTGNQIAALFSQAAGRPIGYSRFAGDVLAANPFLAKLASLFDEGRPLWQGRARAAAQPGPAAPDLRRLAPWHRSRPFSERPWHSWVRGVRPMLTQRFRF